MKILKMFKKKKKINFDQNILRKNDISMLIIDERWNQLFNKEEKTTPIVKCEQNLKHLLKEQARLVTEQKDITNKKKKCMETIVMLTDKAYQENDEKALEEMQQCQKEIAHINERIKAIDLELQEIPEKIKQANMELLEETVNAVYTKIKTSEQTIKQLESEIGILKDKLRNSIIKKQELAELVENAYSYFHDLIGKEELERLDKEYME